MQNWKNNGWRTATRKPVKNIDLWQQLDEEVQRHKVNWRWVKGHSGNVGNEFADQLANAAIDSAMGA
jgi:ribonuclease HI